MTTICTGSQFLLPQAAQPGSFGWENCALVAHVGSHAGGPGQPATRRLGASNWPQLKPIPPQTYGRAAENHLMPLNTI